MKAIVCSRYGPPDVLEIRDIPKPTPKDNEVLIKVHATTVTSGDWRVRSGIVPRGFGALAPLFLGFSGPRQPILGTELAGDIESVGRNVRRFKVGDPVFAFAGASMGCYVEYKAMPEDGPLAPKPANLSYEEAAALSFGGSTALVLEGQADYLRRALEVNRAAGIPLTIWYNWQEPVCPWSSFGLLDVQGRPKPAYRALSHATSAAGGARR